LTKGKYCSYEDQSLHEILEKGKVGEITSSCKSKIKTAHFDAVPGEIVLFVSGAT
jgi:hypothetical protein